MSLESYFMPDAVEQFEDACRWYEKQAPTLLAALCDEIEKALHRIESNPEGFAVLHKDFRHVIVRRFPYVLIYRLRPPRIEIHAVYHTHRDIDTWKRTH